MCVVTIKLLDLLVQVQTRRLHNTPSQLEGKVCLRTSACAGPVPYPTAIVSCIKPYKEKTVQQGLQLRTEKLC